MMTADEYAQVHQDDQRRAARALSPCDDFELYSKTTDHFCLNCLWDKDDHRINGHAQGCAGLADDCSCGAGEFATEAGGA